MYALSAWVGYLNRDSINHSDAIIKKAVRCKLTQDCHSFYQFLTQCDSRLFSQSLHVDHCLHHVFTCNNRSSLALRECGHPFEFPRYKLLYCPSLNLWSPYVIGQTIYIFILFLLLSSSSFFPRLISAVGDWMFTILWHMVWP